MLLFVKWDIFKHCDGAFQFFHIHELEWKLETLRYANAEGRKWWRKSCEIEDTLKLLVDSPFKKVSKKLWIHKTFRSSRNEWWDWILRVVKIFVLHYKSRTLWAFYSVFSIVLVYHTGTKIHFLYIYPILIKLNESKIWIP